MPVEFLGIATADDGSGKRPRPGVLTPAAHRPGHGRRLRRRTSAAALATALLALTACGGGNSAGQATGGGNASPGPSEDVLSSVRKDDSLARLVPPDLRRKGTLRLATAVGAPPNAYYPDPAARKPVGQDIDIADAVGKILGLKVEREEASFEAILPALGSGKYDVGTGNFGVTDERRRTIDFVTYINDGQGFAARKDDRSVGRITSLSQLCGKTIGVGAGTTFEDTLNANKSICAASGKRPYVVKVFSENGAVLTSLQQGRLDVTMSTINGLRHQAAQPAAGVRFLGEFHRLDVGFAFKKGSPLTKPFQAAVNELMANGTYDRILEKWGTEQSAIDKSEISPPEKKYAEK